jgi:hypothetical protein
MRKAHKGLGLGAALALVAGGLLVVVTQPVAKAAPAVPVAPPCTISAASVISAGLAKHIGGVVPATGTSTATNCTDPPPPPEPAFNGTPPVLFHGAQGAADCTYQPCDDGNLMATRATGPLVIVPIFWNPTAYPMSSAYKNIIVSYIHDVAAASTSLTNVFSVLTEYYGHDGSVLYRFDAGPTINDTDPLPASGCTLQADDTSKIYADGSGYSACLDDAQLQAEVNTVSATYGLPHNLSYIYELFLPKHVESCFLPGQTTSTSNGQACTINYEATAAYCAYHSTALSNAVYTNLDYPIYGSPTGFTCGSDARFPVVESPNGNPDADTEVSPLSHETSESITDPDTETGWYDSSGYEISDECAYIYGATQGSPGALYNQTINGQHFLTQQEFSNNVFERSNGTAGCVDSLLNEYFA